LGKNLFEKPLKEKSASYACINKLASSGAQLVPIGILIVCWNLGKYIVDIVLFIVFYLYCFLYPDYHDHTMTFLLSPIVILLIILICQDDTINHGISYDGIVKMIVKLKCISNSTGITRYACQSPHVVKREEFYLYGLYLDLVQYFQVNFP
jgi:hypothetical protein